VKYKYSTLVLGVILCLAAPSTIHAQASSPSPSGDWVPLNGRPADSPPAAGRQQKIDALNDAYRNGLLTRAEYEAKLQAINGGGSAPGRVNITDRTRWVEVMDPAWGIPAARFQIPADWNFDGILIRDPSCGLTPSIAWRISSPDGLYGAQMMPDFGSNWSNGQRSMEVLRRFHCKIMEPPSPEEFLQYVVPLVRPNPTLGPLEPTDDAQQFQGMIENYNRRSEAAFGVSQAQVGGAVRSRIQYTYRGHTMEENFAVRLQTFKHKGGYVGGPPVVNWFTTVNVRTIRAPKGQLEEVLKILSPMLWPGGYTPTPQWSQRFSQKLQADTNAAIAAQKVQADAAQAALNANHEAMMQAQNERFAAEQKVSAAQVEAMHRSAVAYTLYAGDNQLVRNPQTGVVSTVTNKYGSSVWQEDGTNNVLLQNPNDMNPNLYLRGTYTQLENLDPMRPF